MTDAALTKCPSCKTKNLSRIIGSGAGLVFKGSGYYLTDYKKSETGTTTTTSTKEKSPPKETTETTNEVKTETKPDSKKSTTKPASKK